MTGLVMLDRDGVINFDSPEFIRSVSQWQPFPGSLEAIARLNRGGYDVVVCTNQSGLSRGLLDEATLQAIHERMCERIHELGGTLRGVFVCPHGPDAGCDCRKPRPGLLHQVASRLGRPVTGSPMIGDSLRDLQAAEAAGARPVLVRTGKGEATLAQGHARGVPVFDDLAAAADAIVDGALER